MQLMYKVRDDLATMAQVEMEPKTAGRNITMTLSPLPANKRKRRFSLPNEEIEEDKRGDEGDGRRRSKRSRAAKFFAGAGARSSLVCAARARAAS